MVTVLRRHGMRCVVYTADHEPPHVPVYGDGEARIDIVTLTVLTQGGLSDRDVRRAVDVLAEHRTVFLEVWKNIMVDVSDAELAAAKRRWALEKLQRPIPSSARFDPTSARIVVEFTNNAVFMVPARDIEGLTEATDVQLAEVELLGETGLHWESLDVDYTIEGLMSGVFGSRSFLEAQRKGGRSRSSAKATASRVNGSKGGRPRKIAENS